MHRVRGILFFIAVGVLCGFPGMAAADVLMLKDGQAITGKFQGGDQTTVNFEVDGKLRRYSLSEINSITFTAPPAPARAASESPSYATGRSASSGTTPSSSAAAAPAKTMGITVPAGTQITVRMIDLVDSSVNQIGETFRASLDEPLIVGGKTVAARGADVTAKLTEVAQAGRIAGRSELTLILLDITIEGRKREVTTSEVSEAGASRGRQTATRVGVGAAIGATIGAIAGGGKGAATGAAAGAGAGTAIQVLTRGEQVKIPAESRLVFTLQNSLNL